MPEGRFDRGPCTLIVARKGALDLDCDEALLEAVEGAAGLPTGALHRSMAMDAREFRLIEGVSRRLADEVAGRAAQLGYLPRVRDRLGIKWSSERGPEMSLWFAAGWLLFGLGWAAGFPMVDVVFGPAARLPVMLLTIPVAVTALMGLYRWQLSRLFMPLVVSALALPDPEAGALGEAAHEALDGIGRLDRALSRGVLPAFAVQDLALPVASLRRQVSDRLAEARRLERQSRSALAAVQGQLAALPDDADDAEFDRVTDALEAAEAEEIARDQARAHLVEELLGIRALALDALRALQADDGDLAPVEALRRASGNRAEARERARPASARPQRQGE